eukprot:EG_transcript_44997
MQGKEPRWRPLLQDHWLWRTIVVVLTIVVTFHFCPYLPSPDVSSTCVFAFSLGLFCIYCFLLFMDVKTVAEDASHQFHELLSQFKEALVQCQNSSTDTSSECDASDS